ncbi:Anthranilate phosphoribosyltransferase [Linum perenne]
MEALLSHQSPSISIRLAEPRRLNRPNSLCSVRSIGAGRRWIGRSRLRTVKAVLDSATLDQLGITESEIRNPTVSSSYRSSKLQKPNQTVLDAQARVCTGPEMTKPLTEDQAFKVFDTILRSARGELKDEERVSRAQLGAFFAGMTIRANVFPEATQWSEGERRAVTKFWPELVRVLPPDVVFIADPEGSIMSVGSSIGPQFVGNDTTEMRLVGALREVLAGGHLGYEEVQGVLRDVLPLDDDESSKGSLVSAFLIGQRMNRETDRELKAYCLAFDDELGNLCFWPLGPPPVADVRSLTHYGEPYDGNTRFFRSTLFVAAVRSCYEESSLLHGVDWMPPKGGITEEQMLKFMGASTNLTPLQAKDLLEDEDLGFAYISQREAHPSLYSLIGLREHIKKRPPLATTEKVQQLVRVSHILLCTILFHVLKSIFVCNVATLLLMILQAKGREAIVAGFYHGGYEEPLLMLMRRRGVHSGLVVKGEEGALSMTTRLRSGTASKGLPVNYCSGFRSSSTASALEVDGVSRQSFSIEVNAKDYGFEPTDTPRTDRSVSKNIELGLAALHGEKGPAYDRIVLNAGMIDHLLGCDDSNDIYSALDRARDAIDSGRALKRLLSYIKATNKMK